MVTPNLPLWKFIPENKNTFCANTIGYGLEHIDIDILSSSLTAVPKKLKENKAYRNTIGGLHIVALDGTEYFRAEGVAL